MNKRKLILKMIFGLAIASCLSVGALTHVQATESSDISKFEVTYFDSVLQDEGIFPAGGDKHATGVLKGSDGNWYYFKSGIIDITCNEVMHNNSGWWVIQEGKVNFNYNGLASNKYGTWYCQNGKVNFNANGVLNTPQGWYYIKGGKVQTGKETVQNNSSGWWYIGTDGKVDFKKNTVAQNSNGWWVIQNGKVNFNYNGLASNSNGIWYCQNGKVNFNANGVLNTPQGWYYIKGGKVQTGSVTIQKNNFGWWYIGTDGKVNFSYTGLASNANGTWYCQNGKVNFNYNDANYVDSVTSKNYKILNGKATEIDKAILLPDGYTAVDDRQVCGSLKDVILNNDGTYTATWDFLDFHSPIYITQEQYKNIKIGTCMDFGTTDRYKNFHCVKDTDAYYFVPKSYKSVEEVIDDEIVCIYKNMGTVENIRVYSTYPVATDKYSPAYERTLVVKNAKTIITKDATIALFKTYSKLGEQHKFSDFFNSNNKSVYNRSDAWRGTSWLWVYADENGRIIKLIEQEFCG